MTNAFWRELLDQIPAAILLFRIDEREQAHLMFANDNTRELTGFSPADLVLESEQNPAMRASLTELVDAIAAKAQHQDNSAGVWAFPLRSGNQKNLSFSYRIFTSRSVSQPFICVELEQHSAESAQPVSLSVPTADSDELIVVSSSVKAIVERFTWFAGQPVNLVFTGDSGMGKKTLARRFARYNASRNGQPFVEFTAGDTAGFEDFLKHPAPVKAVWNIEKTTLDQQQALVKTCTAGSIRLIASAKSALELLIDQGTLIPELVYSLNFVSVTVPPLARRKEDAIAYIRHLAATWSSVFEAVSEAAEITEGQILELDWQGNYPMLRQSFRRLCNDMEPGNDWDDPQFELFGEAGLPGPLTFNEYNRAFLKTVLKFTKGKIYGEDGAAKLLGLKPTTLQSKLKKLGIR